MKIVSTLLFHKIDTIIEGYTVIAPEVPMTDDPNHLGSYHSESSEAGEIVEDEDTMRGVSNVVYRKEFVFFGFS